MKIKKLLSALLIASVVTLSATACGTSTPTVSTSSIPSTESAVSQSSAVNSNTEASEVSLNKNDDFDFDEVCKNVVINGKKYTFPFSLDDLGEGYTFDNIKYWKVDKEKETYTVYADILYNDQKILDVSIHNVAKEYYKKDDKITSVPITFISQDCWKSSGMNENTNYIKIAGLKIGDKSEDVKNKLGEAHEIIYTKSVALGSYTYYKDNIYSGKCLCYTFDDNGYVDSISILDE